MNTAPLKKFAQSARRYLREQVSNQLEQILSIDTAENRSNPAVKDLLKEVEQSSKDQVIEKVAYLWFNRFCALRFMDANDYNSTLIVSPTEGMTLPEILQEAKQGNIDEELQVDASDIMSLMNESKQDEAYRLLLVAACNQLSTQMPFMFEKISDFTELLLPKDLLSENSILSETREALTNEVCQDVEVIGWLYQFYISEKKDEVFDGLKKNKKITPENIPAATQLFTPNWIVRYLVENSLGRLWMLNKPNSRLIDQMEYYIKPEQEETDFLKVTSPEELKVCDPACGSGHMLVYAFELLYAIYEEEGYDAPEIPGLILTNNLFGLELDERAGELAAFALTMKARESYRRFFRKAVQPNICVLEKVEISTADMEAYMTEIGRDIFTTPLEETIRQFKDADNFGSLICPIETDVAGVRKLLAERGVEGNMFLAQTHAQVQKVLRMVEFLSPRYQVVVANPPYMGKKNMNSDLQEMITSQYLYSSSDFFSAFIERSLQLMSTAGFTSMVTMDSWMFGDDYTEFREQLLLNYDVKSLAHLGPHAFEEIKGEVVQVAAFVFGNQKQRDSLGIFFDLTTFPNSESKRDALLSETNKYIASINLFKELPRKVIGYYVTPHTKNIFDTCIPLREIAEAFTGLQTGDNERFIRKWYENSFQDICFDMSKEKNNVQATAKWYPYVKGSEYRKWYGNNEFVLNWEFDGREIKSLQGSRPQNQQYYFRSGLAYNNISNHLSTRLVDSGYIFDQKNSMFFSDAENDIKLTMCLLHSKAVLPLLRVIAPKDFGPGSMKLLPVIRDYKDLYFVIEYADTAVKIAKHDWDSAETSWDFQSLALITMKNSNSNLAETYANLRENWQESTFSLQHIEEKNNKVFIGAYGLANKLSPEVSLCDITLNGNPEYRYQDTEKRKLDNDQKEGLLLQDTIKEFVSYAVGCMFGRYSLDKPGLILANTGETLEDYLKQVPQPTFEPDDDNVIPLMDVDWFGDDIAERFKTFLKVTFGGANYEENLRFVEDALGYKTTGKSKRQSIRDYFLKDFYTDHWKRYKKRPIYWMFSSPKGTFNALIYMHRYRPDTVSTVLNEYLREFSQKLTAHRDNKKQEILTAEGKLKIALEKEITTLGKQIEELADYERDLYELASKSREELTIDLDDGVKVNYPKFGGVLKTISGLSK